MVIRQQRIIISKFWIIFGNTKRIIKIFSNIWESLSQYYYKTYNQGLTIYQKPGYVREALNVDAIVMEDTPYLIAIYTRYLGGSDEETSEINNVGLQQLEMLCYVINEWHRVNMN